MTEEIAATPGWVDQRLDDLFHAMPDSPAVASARQVYAACLAARKAPGAPSDMLGAEFNGCRSQLDRALKAAGVTLEPGFDAGLEALEAEIAGDS